MPELRCSLPGCSFVGKTEPGLKVHEGGHIRRGQAQRGNDGKLFAVANFTPPAPSSPKDKFACELCERKFKGIMSFQSHRAYHVRKGEARWKDGNNTINGVLEATGKTFLAPVAAELPAHPSETEPEEIRQVQIEESLAHEMNESHAAVGDLQKAAALMSFALLMNRVGPEQAQQLVAGMSRIGNGLTGRK